MSLWKKIRDTYLPFRLPVYAGIAALIVTNFCQILIPLFLRQAIDEPPAIAAAAQAIFILAVLLGVFRTLSRRWIFDASRRLEYQVRSDLFAHIQKLPPAYFQTNSTGQIMAHLTNDIAFVRMLYGVGTLHFANTFIVFCLTMAAILRIEWRLALGVLLFFPLTFVVCSRIVKRIFAASFKNQELFGEISEVLNESFAGIRAIKGSNAYDWREQLVQEQLTAYQASSVRLAKLRLLFQECMKIGMGAGMVLILAYGGLLVADRQMTLGDLVAFSAYLAILSWPTQMMGWVVPAVQRGLSSFARLQNILNLPTESQETNTTVYDQPPKVELRQVGFAFKANGPKVLKDFSLVLEPGSKTLIVGTLGAGKSTLLKLLSGYYSPTTGEILVQGEVMDASKIQRLRQLTSFSPQEAFVFSRPLQENIMLSKESGRTFFEAVELAKLEQDVASFAQGWQTWVGEKGVTLSGGQRQRTSLARALYKKHQLLLLDDPIAQLDARTSMEVWSGIVQKLENQTVVLVSQRLLQPESFDQIVVLNQGQIVEQGTHQQLLKAKGYYFNQFQLQSLSLEQVAV